MKTNIYNQSLLSELEMAVEAVVSDYCFCDFGVIKKVEVEADGIVTVAVNVAKDGNDYRIFPCVYAEYTTKSFCFRMKPQEGDKVIIVYPRRYNVDMFDLNKNDIIYDDKAFSYNCVAGIAIPFNQWRSDYKNIVTFDEDNVELKLAQDKVKFTVDKDGNIKLNNEKCTLEMKNDGSIKLNNDNNTLEMNSSSKSVKINEHLEIN